MFLLQLFLDPDVSFLPYVHYYIVVYWMYSDQFVDFFTEPLFSALEMLSNYLLCSNLSDLHLIIYVYTYTVRELRYWMHLKFNLFNLSISMIFCLHSTFAQLGGSNNPNQERKKSSYYDMI